MKKLILIPGLILTLLVSQVAAAAFSDVSGETDYASSITWMADNGVIQGYPDGTFMPDQCVNRAEFLKMMYLTSKKDIIITDSSEGSDYYNDYFSDTSTEQWYWPYVNKALQDGTVEGYPDGTFKPEQCVNRVEAIKMATLEFDLYDENASIYAESDANPRDVDPNAWYTSYYWSAQLAQSLGLEHMTLEEIDGWPNSYFYPGDPMSRKEVAEMLYRMKTIKDNSLTEYSDYNTPEPLNFYISPTSGVSFMMTDEWEVTSDEYYETPGGATSDYPTIQMQGPDEERININFPMMQCEGEFAIPCFDLAEGYIIGAGDPSSEGVNLMNRILLTFRVNPIEETESLIEIDDIWNKYTNNEFGFSINLPKEVTNSSGCLSNEEATTSPVAVFTDSENNIAYISTEEVYNDQCELESNSLELLQSNTDPQPWKLVFRTILDESELDQFIQDVFMPECNVVDLSATEQEDVFSPILNYGEWGEGCFVNWISYTLYSPSREIGVHWDIGQDTHFFHADNMYDLDMGDSFRFE